MGSSRQKRAHLFVLLGYAVVAIVFTWPLTAHLGTALTGPPTGDTGVYVWNQWVFQNEVIENRSLPYFTSTIFSLSGRANLSLHNYTAFQDLVAMPLIRWLGVVPAFNIVYLLMTVLTAYATFLLVRHVTGTVAESWLAGLLFAWSPVLVTRGTGHFSLVAAAPLAVFLLLLLRAAERPRPADPLALGATVWWAASSDAYYAVYCVMLAALFLAARVTIVQSRPHKAAARAIPRTLDVLIGCIAGLALFIFLSGGWQFTFLGRAASMKTAYTPMLLLTLLVCLRLAWSYRSIMVRFERGTAIRVMRLACAAAVFAAIFLSPVLYALGLRIARKYHKQLPPELLAKAKGLQEVMA